MRRFSGVAASAAGRGSPLPCRILSRMTERLDLLTQARALCEKVHDGALLTPFPGRWSAPGSLDQDFPVLAADTGLICVLVDEDTGAVLIVDGSGRHQVNSSIAAFTACAQAYTDSMREVASRGLDDGDHDDELEGIEQVLLRRCAESDPALPGGVDDFWLVAAEEIGLGTAPFPAPARSSRSDAPRPVSGAGDRILLALTDADRNRLFTREQWKRLTSIAPVALARPPHRIETALEVAELTAAAGGSAASRSTVLVTADVSGLTPGLWSRLPELKLVCLLAPAALHRAAAPAGVRTVALPPDADGGELADAIARELSIDGGQ